MQPWSIATLDSLWFPKRIVARRCLTFIGELVCDYLAGRYFRETYTRLEKAYLHYYEAPAMFRASSRFLSQLIVYHILGNIMGWLVGISHPPCHGEGRGLALLCALLWVGAVIGSGHAFSTAVSLWIPSEIKFLIYVLI